MPKLHWILVEDAQNKTDTVRKLLTISGLNYTHLNIASPKGEKGLTSRGVLQRNLALQWIRQTLDHKGISGVVYFADDDNTYSLQVFKEVGVNFKNARIAMYGLHQCLHDISTLG